MEVGGEREALADIADQLCAEFGHAGNSDTPAEVPTQPGATRANLFGESLQPEDEQLIASTRRSLVRIAAALEPRKSEAVPATVVPALIDGAELVMRRELAMGNRLSALMPSFVFLVALPLVDQDEALALSRRTASLLEEKLP